MTFKPELAAAVVEGRKWVTRRLVSDNPRSPYHPDRAPAMEGKAVAICPGRGKKALGRATVVSVRFQHFKPMDISALGAAAEGFGSKSAFWGAWASIHGTLEAVDVWRIQLSAHYQAEAE